MRPIERRRRQIPPGIARRLLADPATRRDERLTARLLPGVFEAFVLGDGRAMEMYLLPTHAFRPNGTRVELRPAPEVGEAWEYRSRQTLEDYLDARAAEDQAFEQGPVPAFRDSLPQGRAFPARMPELRRTLPARIGVPAAQLDLSLGSLRLLDQAIVRLGGRQCRDPDLFAPLAAYVGPLLCGATGGQLEMVAVDDAG